MEFRLNKIDLEVRERIKEQTKEGKIHSKRNITIQKDKKDGNSKNKDFYEQLKKEYKDKSKKIKINAVRYSKKERVNIDATKEKTEGKSNIVGCIIDTKK